MKTEVAAAFYIVNQITAFQTKDTRIHSLPWVWIRVFRRALFSGFATVVVAVYGR
jgi:hypothetical protein